VNDGRVPRSKWRSPAMQREDAAIDPLIAGEAIEHRPYIISLVKLGRSGGLQKPGA
jgi:hypothetical protein